MEEEEGNGAVTPPLEPRRHELLAAAVREGSAWCLSSLAIRLRGTLLSSWFIPRYIHVCVYMMSHTHICHQTKMKFTDLHTHIHIHTGMRATKVKVDVTSDFVTNGI